MKSLLNRLLVAAIAISPALVHAHPGHGVIEGWAHWFTPEHVLPALIAVGMLVYFLDRKKDRE